MLTQSLSGLLLLSPLVVSAAAQTFSTKDTGSATVQLLLDSLQMAALTRWQTEINQIMCPTTMLHT